MFVFVRRFVAGVTLAVVFSAAPSCAAGQPAPPAPAPQGQISLQPNSDYGPGGHAVIEQNPAQDTLQGMVSETPRGQAPQNNAASDELSGTVINIYDPRNALRRRVIDFFSPISGSSHKIEMYATLLDAGGHPSANLEIKYDPQGGLSYSDFTHYGLHGERTAEEVTNYRTDGYEIKDWSLGTHQWYSHSITYKTPLPAGAPAQTPLVPTNTNIGVLFPRSYLPGETITGSLWPSTYAENFKTVPGLSEYSFPIQLYHLPDGSLEWSSLEIGVKGDGYVPVNPNGTFSLHIPYDWKGPLQLQARQPDPVAGVGPSEAQLNIGEPVAAPTLANDQFPEFALNQLNEDIEDHLVDLWEDACDDEEILDRLYSETTPDWARIYAVEDELDQIYDEIDYIEDDLPPREVISLAQGMLQEATSFHDWLSNQTNLTADDRADLKDSSYWAEFLDNEIGYNKYLAGWGPVSPLNHPFWTSPVLMQGKLGEIGGSFPIDPCDTHLQIDSSSITPLAATPNNWYFMPPPGLTAGLHNYIIDSPFYPETIFPVFSMTLYMSADNLNLLKGQSTTYHVILSGLNGLPGGAWSGASDPTDLVGSSELSAAQKAVGTSRTGYITLSVTNGSPGVIAMQDQFLTFNAASFVPNGSHETDGVVTALIKGSFTINGVARANLDPEIGIGIPPGTATPAGFLLPQPGTLGASWLPPFSVNYDPAAFSKSPFLTHCSGSGAQPATAPTPTGGQPATTPCAESVIDDLMPPKSNSRVNEVQDNANQPDLTQLPEAAKRVEDARTNEKTTFEKWDAALRQQNLALADGLSDVPRELQDDWHKALDNRSKAEKARGKQKDIYKKTPNDDNATLLAIAEQDVVDAGNAENAAFQKVIDSFKFDKREAYDQAHAAAEKAYSEWKAAENELRAANEALQKLQAATAK